MLTYGDIDEDRSIVWSSPPPNEPVVMKLLNGTVVDSDGNALEGASVTGWGQGTGGQYPTVKTNADGIFEIHIAVGIRSRLTASIPGRGRWIELNIIATDTVLPTTAALVSRVARNLVGVE